MNFRGNQKIRKTVYKLSRKSRKLRHFLPVKYALLISFVISLQGCGNQIFDYSKIIILTQDNKITPIELEATSSSSLDAQCTAGALASFEMDIQRPSTRTIDSWGENPKQLPVVEIESQPG